MTALPSSSSSSEVVVSSSSDHPLTAEINQPATAAAAVIPLIAKVIILFTSSNLLALALYWNSIVIKLTYDLFGHSNLVVGVLSAVCGMLQLAAAFVSGYFTDKNPAVRPRVLFVAAVVGLIAVAFMGYAVAYDWNHKDDDASYETRRKRTLPWWIAASALLGVFQGLSGANVEATIASVIPKGGRDRLYAVKGSFEALSGVSGCIVAVILFASQGNDWSLRAMSVVVCLGLGVHCLVMLVLMWLSKLAAQWRDEHPEDDDPHRTEDEPPQQQHDEEDDDGHFSSSSSPSGSSPRPEAVAAAADPQAGVTSSSVGENNRNYDDYGDADDYEENAHRCRCCCYTAPFKVSRLALPYVVTAQDLLLSLSSGMTTRYYILFLISDYNCSPLVIVGCLFGSIVCAAIFIQTNVYLTTKITTAWRLTRIQGILFSRFFAPPLLLWMALCTPSVGWPGSLGAILVVFMLRHGAMNSTVAMSRSLIMDVVPKRQRARWNAVESLLGASWAGSALLGGWLSDKFNYRSTFLITVALQVPAWLLLATAFRTDEVRHRHHHDDRDRCEAKQQQAEDNHSNNGVDNDPTTSGDFFRNESGIINQSTSSLYHPPIGANDHHSERTPLLRS